MAVLGMHNCHIHYLLHLKTFNLFFRMTFLIAEGVTGAEAAFIVFTSILFELYLVSYSKVDDTGITMQENLQLNSVVEENKSL
ncbi:hypothetical protein RJ639_046003, partial [Escallonia herrerae]